MSGLSQTRMAGNLNDRLSLAGSALCALGDVLQAAEIEELKAGQASLRGLGYLLEIVGVDILEHSQGVTELLAAIEEAPTT